MQENLDPSIKTPVISNKPRTIVDYSEQEAKVLYSVKSIFPLDPFPATISIQTAMVGIVHNLFGISQQVMTVPIADLFSVEIEAGLFFATIKLQQKQANIPIIEIPYILKDPAFKARRILQGLIIVSNQNLEIPDMHKADVIPYLEEIGSTHV